MSLIQNRPEAARKFIENVLATKDQNRQWVTEHLKMQIPLAALLAAETGEGLPQLFLSKTADQLVDWIKRMPWPCAERTISEIALTIP